MKILKLGIILFIVCAISAAGLSLVYKNTAERIAKGKKEKMFSLQKEILPDAIRFKAESDNIQIGYNADNQQIGKIVFVIAKGYSGPIEMLVGIDNDGNITKLKIVKQSETPGLGANIKKLKFLDQFSGKSELKLDKDNPDGNIEALTGATISSRAVVEAVDKAINGVGSTAESAT